jgi:hypothetical protein
VGDLDPILSREERDRIQSAAGSERWALSLAGSHGRKITRVVYVTARAPGRWWWKVDDGAGSATLAYATREVDSALEALHDAQREVLFCEPGHAVVRVTRAKEVSRG